MGKHDGMIFDLRPLTAVNHLPVVKSLNLSFSIVPFPVDATLRLHHIEFNCYTGRPSGAFRRLRSLVQSTVQRHARDTPPIFAQSF